ncbi:ribosome biogenesis factor YjgA [Marinobacter caseinilyticus]|uniref:ribosome biogenesis factor YjgA n=1 Tax=Marinobacter caseinilyticus TaxID=2692195 RepID=UPI00140E89EE|nr:ribosome biogenesis factor YjgA [Marinobacter caseinilyticus]
MNDQQSDDQFEDELGKSKSQLKREMHALQDLGKHIMELRADQLIALPMSDRLRHAIEESQRIRQREARRRHLQYLGKVIRLEENIDELLRAVEAVNAGSHEHTRRLHLAERWRDRFIAEGDTAVGEFLDYCPSAEVQHLRNLVRNARRDAEKGTNTGHSTKLFRYLRERIDQDENQGTSG